MCVLVCSYLFVCVLACVFASAANVIMCNVLCKIYYI